MILTLNLTREARQYQKKKKKEEKKSCDDDVMLANCDILSLFRFMANLEQHGSRFRMYGL